MTDWTFGPRLDADGTTFRLWAPGADRVDLVLDETVPMQKSGNGWHNQKIERAGAGTRYQFRIDGNLIVPDPASHFQPNDVFAPSVVIDHRTFPWRASNWRGRPWHETVLL
ncbi:MAG: malto-oligosyltrehalose trehalohydrolase, partial [Oxalobacteraceae bacterium]